MIFKRLFEPGTVGKMEVKNRIVMAPMGTGSHDPEGFITGRTVDFYVERARGGVGLIMGQSSACLREGRAPGRPGLWDDKFIPGLKKVTEGVHNYDCKVGWQVLYHGKLLSGWLDRITHPEETKIIGPSSTPWIRTGVAPKEADAEDIELLVEGYSEGARRIRDAGCDIAELHCAHGYGISQWLSPRDNKRTDDYGGSVEKRARIVCDILRRTREKVGSDFPISLRLSGADFLPGGITVEDTMHQAPLFIEAGADVLHISACEDDTTQWQFLSYLFPDGAIVHLAEKIKKIVDVPVITVGKIGDPVLADRILEEGKADFVAMGRALLADPELPNKAQEGRFDEIRRCIYCNNCLARLSIAVSGGKHQEKRGSGFSGLACTVNPAVLQEKEFALRPAITSKKVMVVGGGIAGMEAARTLAERGHRVSLYDKADKLGGQWLIVCQDPQKVHFGSVLDWQVPGLAKAGVQVILNREVTRQFVEQEKPDAVVVATGSVPMALEVPGVKNQNVVQAVDLLSGKAQAGNRVVVVGGRLRGMEVALKLAQEGKRVTITTKKALGENGVYLDRCLVRELRNRLIELGVCLFTQSPVHEIRENGLFIEYNRDLVFLRADTVVLAVGSMSENRLAWELEGVVQELYTIGDCTEPRDALDAIHDGARVGRII
jgi:2,4-dienoyl-CoA reductase-like NADH-dependent reductase (Old Yellow Enzyme family)/thioredoxin reductase